MKRKSFLVVLVALLGLVVVLGACTQPTEEKEIVVQQGPVECNCNVDLDCPCCDDGDTVSPDPEPEPWFSTVNLTVLCEDLSQLIAEGLFDEAIRAEIQKWNGSEWQTTGNVVIGDCDPKPWEIGGFSGDHDYRFVVVEPASVQGSSAFTVLSPKMGVELVIEPVLGAINLTVGCDQPSSSSDKVNVWLLRENPVTSSYDYGKNFDVDCGEVLETNLLPGHYWAAGSEEFQEGQWELDVVANTTVNHTLWVELLFGSLNLEIVEEYEGGPYSVDCYLQNSNSDWDWQKSTHWLNAGLLPYRGLIPGTYKFVGTAADGNVSEVIYTVDLGQRRNAIMVFEAPISVTTDFGPEDEVDPEYGQLQQVLWSATVSHEGWVERNLLNAEFDLDYWGVTFNSCWVIWDNEERGARLGDLENPIGHTMNFVAREEGSFVDAVEVLPGGTTYVQLVCSVDETVSPLEGAYAQATLNILNSKIVEVQGPAMVFPAGFDPLGVIKPSTHSISPNNVVRPKGVGVEVYNFSLYNWSADAEMVDYLGFYLQVENGAKVSACQIVGLDGTVYSDKIATVTSGNGYRMDFKDLKIWIADKWYKDGAILCDTGESADDSTMRVLWDNCDGTIPCNFEDWPIVGGWVAFQ